MGLYGISDTQFALIALLVLWDLGWKSVALWKAARNNSVGWFVTLLLINSVGILPMIYLLIDKSARSSAK